MGKLRVLVLDAMGVVYSVGDDVQDLLCPFIAEKGGSTDIARIEKLYHSASLGKMPASEFWAGVGVDPRLEDEYLQKHELTVGLIAFLHRVRERGYEPWCLSNDVAEWSLKLRARFGLDSYFRGFIVSGDIGIRKPDRAIFDHLLRRLSVQPPDIVFVDDQPKNLDTAAALGIRTVLFNPLGAAPPGVNHEVAQTLTEALALLS